MLSRLIEILLGLPRRFLSEGGELSVRFNPVWPWQDVVGAGVWNLALMGLLGWLIVHVYRREGRSRRVRLVLGALRGALALLVLLLLNRPVVTMTLSRVEPSVVAVLVDDSLSMRVRDQAMQESGSTTRGSATPATTLTRLDAVKAVLGDEQKAGEGLLSELARTHQLRVFRFDRNLTDLGVMTRESGTGGAGVFTNLRSLEPGGQGTSIASAIAKASTELSGQRLAGVVVLTDGRENPARSISDAMSVLRSTGTGRGGGASGGDGTSASGSARGGVKVFPVGVGLDRPPRNLAVDNVVVQDSAFRGDLVSVRVTIHGTGYPTGQRVKVRITDSRTKAVLPGPGGKVPVAETEAVLSSEAPMTVEVPVKPEQVGTLDLAVTVSAVGPEAGAGDGGGGEVDEQDNTRIARLAVLDAKVAVLYAEGYPRWDYRFLRTELIRDKTVEVSILLTGADEGFAQEGDKPIRRFPETMEELLPYDAVIIGDVDPRQFTDAQLQLISDYVGKKGGGLLMVAGPRYDPLRYRGTALEAVLPVRIPAASVSGAAGGEGGGGDIVQGFRPVVTTAGQATGIFRFLADLSENEKFLRNDWQPIFWYLRGVSVKPGVGEVLAEHPSELGPDGRKAPILVAGRYGAGRTLFSAIDDSWRWRYYTGESVFDTYWVQQIRLLARNRKLGQRLFSLSTQRQTYDLGDTITATLRILEPNLLKQLPDQIEADVVATDESGALTTGARLQKQTLVRQDDRPDTYVASFPADRLGRAAFRVNYLAPGVDTSAADSAQSATQAPYEVVAPRLELSDVRLDSAYLDRLATETGGTVVSLTEATQKLPGLIKSAEKIIPTESSRPLWDAPLVMALFVVLITAEWVLRKLAGMV